MWNPCERIPETEFLTIDTWKEFATSIGPPLQFCNGYEIDGVFKALCMPGPPVIIVTGCCDAGLVYQSEYPPSADLRKHANAVDWDALAKKKESYHRVHLGPAVTEGRCHPGHLFSMKTDRHTWCSFPFIPSRVRKWFAVNACIDEKKCGVPTFRVEHRWARFIIPTRVPRTHQGQVTLCQFPKQLTSSG